MQINKEELQQALEIVKPGLASKEMIEQSTSFAFMGDRVVTYNDEISLSYPVTGLELEGAIKAEELYKLLNKIKPDKEGNININVTDTEIIVTADRSKAGLTLQVEVTLPLEEIGKLGKWQPLPDDFNHHLKFAMAACSRDMSRPILTTVHVAKDGYIEASDGFRIARCELGEEMPVDEFLIPANSAREVVKLSPVFIAKGKGWMHFQDEGGAILSCRIFEDDDEYPDTADHLDIKGIEITFPRTIVDALERAGIFSKRDHLLDETAKVTLEDNRLKVESKSDTGWYKEELNIRYKEDPIHFSITPYLFKDILKETLVCLVGEKALKFEGAGWEYLTMLRYK